MPAQYVKAYIKRNKHDAADVEAICEAVQRPTMRFVPVKTADQQTEDKPERFGEEKSAKWHRARAKRLREHGFTKMAEEHEQVARAIERQRQQEQTK